MSEQGMTVPFDDSLLKLLDDAARTCNKQWPNADSPASAMRTVYVGVSNGISELAQLRTQLSAAEKRIREIAHKHCADYPNLSEVDGIEKLWAIESTLEGITGANADWQTRCTAAEERAEEVEAACAIYMGALKQISNYEPDIEMGERWNIANMADIADRELKGVPARAAAVAECIDRMKYAVRGHNRGEGRYTCKCDLCSGLAKLDAQRTEGGGKGVDDGE